MDEDPSNPSNPPNPPPNLPPSPGYGSFDDLYNAVQLFGRQNGLAFSKKSMRQKTLINGIQQSRGGWLTCDRGGNQRVPRGAGIRKSSSHKTDCSYRLKVTSANHSGHWLWHYEAQGSHNHEKSSHPSEHAMHRKLTERQKRQISRLSKHKGLPARTIGAIIRDTEEHALYFRPKDIYNQRQKVRQAELAASKAT